MTFMIGEETPFFQDFFRVWITCLESGWDPNRITDLREAGSTQRDTGLRRPSIRCSPGNGPGQISPLPSRRLRWDRSRHSCYSRCISLGQRQDTYLTGINLREQDVTA